MNGRLSTLMGCQGGFLLETVVAVAIFTLVGTAAVSGLSMTQTTGAKAEVRSIAENVSRNQMEYLFSLPYQLPPSWYPTVTPPAGYSVSAEAQEYVPGDSNVEKVVVTVTRDGQDLFILETMRTKP